MPTPIHARWPRAAAPTRPGTPNSEPEITAPSIFKPVTPTHDAAGDAVPWSAPRAARSASTNPAPHRPTQPTQTPTLTPVPHLTPEPTQTPTLTPVPHLDTRADSDSDADTGPSFATGDSATGNPSDPDPAPTPPLALIAASAASTARLATLRVLPRLALSQSPTQPPVCIGILHHLRQELRSVLTAFNILFRYALESLWQSRRLRSAHRQQLIVGIRLNPLTDRSPEFGQHVILRHLGGHTAQRFLVINAISRHQGKYSLLARRRPFRQTGRRQRMQRENRQSPPVAGHLHITGNEDAI